MKKDKVVESLTDTVDVGSEPDVVLRETPLLEDNPDLVEVIEEAKDRYDKAVEADRENRKKAREDLAFLDGDQWPGDVQKERKNRLMLTLNRMPGFVKLITGEIRQNRPAITCHPATVEATNGGAQVMEGLVRHIETVSQSEVAYIGAADLAASCGLGAWRVNIEYSNPATFNRELKILPIANPFSVVIDPLAVRSDSADARYVFIEETMPRDDFDRLYPKFKGKGSAEFGVSTGVAEQDKNKDTDDEQVKLVEYWRRVESEDKTLCMLSNGQTVFESELKTNKDLQTIMAVTGVQVIKTRVTRTQKIVWMRLCGDECVEGPIDWEGDWIPIVTTYGDLTFIEGKKRWSGVIRWAKDAQMLYNFWKTVQAETIALQPKTPWLATAKNIKGFEKDWVRANIDMPSVLKFNPDPDMQGFFPRRESPPQGSEALFREAMGAVDDMKALTNLYDASLGNTGNETSGRAIFARQRQGGLANFGVKDNLRRAIEHTGRIIINLVPEVYRDSQYVRIMGLDGKSAIQKLQGEGGFSLDVGKYDVVAEMGPSYATLRQEAQDQMVEFLKSIPGQAPLVAHLVVEGMDFPKAQEIAAILRAANPILAQMQSSQAPGGAGVSSVPMGGSPMGNVNPGTGAGMSQPGMNPSIR